MTTTTEIGGLHSLCSPNPDESAPLLIFLHGFGDHGGAFDALLQTEIADRFRAVAPDLPGCGRSTPERSATTIEGMAGRVMHLIDEVDGDASVGLIGHSLGSAIAVATAERLGTRCTGVFSIEGNLTSKDAYFSGQAAKWADAGSFKAHLVKGTRNMAHFKPELVRYANVLEMADADTLWHLGNDAHRCGREDALGRRHRALQCPGLYYWGRQSTPAVTQQYLQAHDIRALEYSGAGHWPMIGAPAMCADAVGSFFAAAR